MKRVLLALMLAAAACSSSSPSAPAQGAQGNETFICPMECKQPGQSAPYTQRGPGECPVCGMALEAVSAHRGH